MPASAVQPAIAHPPTRAALDRARSTATTRLVQGVGAAAGAAVLGLVWSVGDEPSTPQAVVGLVSIVLSIVAGFLLVVGAWRLRRALQVAAVLDREPWHVVGPFRWREVQLGRAAQGNRLDFTLVAVGRRGDSTLKSRMAPLLPGWDRPGAGADPRDVKGGLGGDVWVTDLVGRHRVLGLADGSGLALLLDPPRLYAAQLGRHLAVLEP